MNPSHVRFPVNRLPNAALYADPRTQSNPQPIPPPNSFQRGGPSIGRGYSNFSPSQSPQHVHYGASPSMYSGAVAPTSDNSVSYAGNSVAPPSAMKTNSNGQYPNVWPGQRLTYAPRAHQPQPMAQQMYPGTSPITTNYSQSPMHKPSGAYQNYQQSTPTMMPGNTPPFIRMSQPMRPRHAPPNTLSSTAPVQPQLQGTTSFYPTQQPFYPHQPNPMAQPFAHSGHQAMHTPPMMQIPQQAIPQATSSARKVITIKDPNTLQDVTKDILQSGKTQTDLPAHSGHSASSSTSSPGLNVPVTDSQGHVIAAQFASQVAAAATQSPTRPVAQQNAPPIQTEGRMENKSKPTTYPPLQHPLQTGSMMPPTYDTSVPPPSIQGMPPRLPMQMRSPYVAGNIPKGIQASNIAPPPMRPDIQTSRLSNTRPDAPVAVVQPVPNQTHINQHVTSSSGDSGIKSVEIAIKHGVPTDQKIEEILTTAKAIVKLEDSKHEVIISDIVTTNTTSEPTENLSKVTDYLSLSNSEEVSEEFNKTSDTQPLAKENSSVKDNSSIITSIQTNQSSEDKVIKTAKKTVPETIPADMPPLESEPVADDSVPSTVATSASQGDAVASVASRDDKVVAEEKPLTKVVADDESTQKDGGVYLDVRPMSVDSFVADDNKKPSSDVQVMPSLVSEDDLKPAIVQSMPDTPSSEVTSDQPSEGGSASRTDESKELAIEKQESLREISQEEMDAANHQKKIYDRAFLMQFRFHDRSLEKPLDLPIIEDIIMDVPIPKSSISNALPSVDVFRGGSDFIPNWMGGGGGGHRPGRNTSRGARSGGQQRGQGGNFMPKIIKKVSIQREPELSKAENAWKPSKLDQKSTSTGSATEEEQTEEILRNVRAILNKLTPSKFSALMQKFQLLPINTEIRLREVINLIFEKAIDEPNFCEAYANMCRTMSQIRVTTSADGTVIASQSGVTVEFRKILLTRCQREFEKDRTNEEILLQHRKKVEGAKTTEEKQQAKEELDVAEAKERRRMLGNIRFIGELFKLNMLTESIMHNCIMTLFKSREEESLESLCRLLTTIGKDLDHQKGRQRMDQYFNQIDKIIRERKTSERVRFMLMDVVDLRLTKWVQRAIKAQGPKTIDQIHADAKEEKEQHALQVAAAAVAPSMKPQPRGGRMGSRGSGGHNVDDGWTKVGLQQKPIRYDPQKMKLSKQQFDESNVTLGPSRGKSGWKSGSGSSATKTGSGGYSVRDSIDAPRSSTPTTMNRFSALGASGGQDSYSQRASGRISSQERNKTDSRGSTGSGGSRNLARDERQSALDTVRRLTSIEKKRASPVSFSPAKTTSAPPAAPALDEATLVKKIKSTIAEFLHLGDVKEATECFDDLKMTSSQGHLIVQTCLEASLEKSSANRANIALLLSHLVSHSKILPEQYVKGVVNNMELANDLELDLPKVWSCLAELVAPIFSSSGGKVKLACLTDLAEPLLEEEKAAIFVVEILKKLTQKMTVDTAVQYWKDSNLMMEHFFKRASQSNIIEFLQRHNLEEFYVSNVQADTTAALPKTVVTFNSYVTNITKQLDSNKSQNEIFEWIEANVSKEDRSQPIFIRALTSAICHHSIKQGDSNLEVDKDLIKRHSVLLKKYIDDDSKELQAVCALQKLFVDLEQPPNILKLLFDCLYDQDVISEQTFFKWKDEDATDCDGKGVALLSVNPFFTWLQDADVESDE